MDQTVDLRKKEGQKNPVTPPPKAGAGNKEISWEFASDHLIDQLFVNATVLIFAGLGLLSIFIGKNMSLGILFIVSSLVIAINIFQKPKIISIHINTLRILLDGKMFYFKDLRSFWIQYQPLGLKELIIETNRWYLPHIHIPLILVNPVQLRSFLIQYLPEKEYQQSMVDIFSRKIGF